MALTVGQVISEFPGWEIQDAAGGGWYAVRIVLVPKHSGLSNVRCGASLSELRQNLEAETRIHGTAVTGPIA